MMVQQIRRQILLGDLVVHEYDRPHGNCVRVVTEVWREYCLTRYLSDGVRTKNLAGSLEAEHDMLARVEDFGVDVEDMGAAAIRFVASQRPATATYKDGAPRRWQSQLPDVRTCRLLVYERWLHLVRRAT